MRKLFQSPVGLMALTIFIDFTGFGLVIPLLPFWAERLGADAVQIGLIMTTYSLAQFLFTPILGRLSDRIGRRPIILWTLGIEALGFLLTVWAPTFWLLIAARFIAGLGASNMGSAQAVVSDTTEPEQRARGMGMMGAAIGLGFVVGPAIGSLASYHEGLPFYIAAGLALLNAILVWRFFPETRKGESLANERKNPLLLIFTGWQKAAHYPAVLRLILTNLLFLMAFSAMESVFALFSQATFGWGPGETGIVFTYIGIIVVLMQGGLVGLLVKKLGERTLLLVGLLLLTLGLLLLPLSNTLALLLVALGIIALGDGAVTPIISTLLSFSAPRHEQGELLGLSQGIGGLGRILGPLLATSLFARGGAMLTFDTAAGMVLLALLIMLPGLRGPQQKSEIPASTPEPAESAPKRMDWQKI